MAGWRPPPHRTSRRPWPPTRIQWIGHCTTRRQPDGAHIRSPTTTPRETPAPRLHILFARDARVAVILRRGPSKRVEIVRWDTASDTFERGHWFHGRIYEHRCDLSPNGKLFCYFASKFTGKTVRDTGYTYAWTAVSRAPWLTALALWPKGDCWHGGGLFATDRVLRLNHRPERAEPHPLHRPKGLTVHADPNAGGEDEPLYSRRLDRDGWSVVRKWQLEYRGMPDFYRTVTPEQRVRRGRADPTGPGVLLTRRLDGLTYSESFGLLDVQQDDAAIPPGRIDWLDFDHRGRLVLLLRGRVLVARLRGRRLTGWQELIDLAPDRPATIEPPPEAMRW